MLDLLTLCIKNDATPRLFLIKLTEAILLKSNCLYFLNDIAIKGNYISILVWSNFSAIWLVSCSIGHYNILKSDSLVLCVLFNKNLMCHC